MTQEQKLVPPKLGLESSRCLIGCTTPKGELIVQSARLRREKRRSASPRGSVS